MQMPVTHEPWLVALSLIVAIQGAYVGLSLAVQVRSAAGAGRRLLLAGAALSLGVAIWSMHFVGMLAARMPAQVDYLVFPTLLSFLVCVLVVGAAVFAASAIPLTRTRLAASAVFMGVGIASMHYIGMMALHASVGMHHDPLLVAASVIVAIAASGLALHLANGASHGSRPPLLLSAAALGIAIAGMHYIAMAAVTIVPGGHGHAGVTAPAISADLLAIVVAIVAFVVSGLFLLILVPDRSPAEATAGGRATAPGSNRPMVGAARASAVSGVEPTTEAVAGDDAATDWLPVLHDGVTIQLPVENIVAVHANAHYTYVFDGSDRYFCQFAIGDIESRLDPTRFARVHRSHIIAVDRIVRLKKTGDNGLVELSGREACVVPVSRSRIGWVRSHLAQARSARTAEVSG